MRAAGDQGQNGKGEVVHRKRTSPTLDGLGAVLLSQVIMLIDTHCSFDGAASSRRYI